MIAPVAQRTEQRASDPRAEVRFLSGALAEVEFPDDDACLEWLWRTRYSADGDTAHCPKCDRDRIFKRYKMTQRRQSWTCTGCGHHVHPTAGTIFHKSSTSLGVWFRAIPLVQGGASARDLERELGVHYKTAWRLLHKIQRPQVGRHWSLAWPGRCEGVIAHGRLGTSIAQRCSRTGKLEVDGALYCRVHAPKLPVVVEDVDEDVIPQCACGCGEDVNPYLGVFVTYQREGFTHAEIAEMFGFTRSYVSALIRKPPRYLKGHSAHTYWQSDAGRARQAAWAFRVAQEKEASARRMAARQAAREASDRRRHAREVARKAKGKFQQEYRRTKSAIFLAVSLDELVAVEKGHSLTGFERHEIIPDPNADPFAALQRARLWELVGDMAPEDIARMDDHAIGRLQQRLLSEGLVDIKVTDAERARLRDPNPHSGASIPKMGRRHGGKRTRKAQQQVTRDHHVRELPNAAKKAHKQLRRVRQAA